MSGDIFYCHNTGPGWGMWWVESKDAALHRTAPTTKNYPILHVNSVEVEEPCLVDHACPTLPV